MQRKNATNACVRLGIWDTYALKCLVEEDQLGTLCISIAHNVFSKTTETYFEQEEPWYLNVSKV